MMKAIMGAARSIAICMRVRFVFLVMVLSFRVGCFYADCFVVAEVSAGAI